MADSLPLLNVYEVETDTGPASLLCFLDPVLAGVRGIESKVVLGRFSEEFDPERFEVNAPFVESITGFMNEEAASSDEIVEQAKTLASGWLYVIDPRDPDGGGEPSTGNVLGAFAVDESGQIVPGSFQYNSKHTLFDRDRGPSGILFDRRFYSWLHGVD